MFFFSRGVFQRVHAFSMFFLFYSGEQCGRFVCTVARRRLIYGVSVGPRAYLHIYNLTARGGGVASDKLNIVCILLFLLRFSNQASIPVFQSSPVILYQN